MDSASNQTIPYGTLKNPSYRPRILDQRIAEGLKIFGAVCIQGPKYCGKTWSGRSLSNSEISLMDPAGNFASRATAELAPIWLWAALHRALSMNGRKYPSFGTPCAIR